VRLIDISQPLSGATAVWPGDQAFVLDWTMRQDRGDSVNVASLTLSVHTGTHIDAPFHVMDGARAAELPLERFYGPVVVVDARGLDALDERVLDRFEVESAQRVLFRTRDTVEPNEFPTRFLHPTAALARRLVQAGLQLVGTDAPSMDAFDSKDLETHKILTNGGVSLLENLVLTAVVPGEYTLIALPLRLVDADGSPVRAVLVQNS
jgi:arylformamidase